MSQANDILETVDFDSGVNQNYRLTTTWYDGSSMTDAKCDGDIYRKNGSGYWKKTIDNKELLKIDTISQLRLQNGYYEGQEILLIGYASAGDKSPSSYKFTINQGVDNGGTIINSSKGSWILQLNRPVNVDDFGAKGDGVSDDSVAFQKAFDSKLDVELTSGKNYLLSNKVFLPAKTFYVDRMNYVYGNGATIIVNLVDDAIFHGAQGTNVFSSKVIWKDINITQKNAPTSTTNKCQAFNLDRLYNMVFFNVSFKNIHTTFKSVAYIQSVDIAKCHFTGVFYQILANRCYNTTFENNFNEGCSNGIVISSTADPDINTLRISKNVFEGGNIPQITLGSCYGATINNNYFEGNIGDNEILLNSPASPYRGLEITFNTFQPTPTQLASTTYCPIRRTILSTFIIGSEPRIIGNATTGEKIISDTRNSFYDSNFELKNRKPFKYQKNHNVVQFNDQWQVGDFKSNIANYVNPDYKLFDIVFDNDGYFTTHLEGSLYFLSSNGTEIGRAYLRANIVIVKKGTDIRKKVIDYVCKNVTITKADGNASLNYINETNFGLTVNNENTFSFQGFTQQSAPNYGLVNSVVFEGGIEVKSRVHSPYVMTIL